MSQVTVTGAAGFIGSHLVQRLADEGHAVIAVVRRREQADQWQARGAQPHLGDVRDPAAMREAVRHADVVYHLAGRLRANSLDEFREVNVAGALNIAEGCAARESPPRLVVVSSLAAAGPSQVGRPRTESDPPAPVSSYGRSKLEAEAAARELADKVPMSIVRPPFVFGGGDRASLPMFRMIHRWGMHLLPCGHDPELSLVHVEDFVSAVAGVADRGRRVGQDGAAETSSGIYNPADPDIATWSSLGRMIGASEGRRVRVWSVGRRLTWCVCAVNVAAARITGRPGMLNFDKLREATAPAWTCSNERSRRELGFTPAAPLGERLAQTAEWYKEANWV